MIRQDLDMNIKEKIEQLLKAMSKGAYEREEVIGLALLCAAAGESIFLLGLPGVGKSMVARRLKMAFRNSTSFEYLMSRFSTPDEIFGPVSISQLKDNDTYVRVIDGYLPTADVVFLDEIWKAGPAIQNSLLTVLNEKIYRNGKDDLLIPLKAVIAASNELPAEGEGLEALWDRFLIRYIVKPIRNKDLFMILLCGEPEECVVPEEIKLTDEDLRIIKEGISKVSVPDVIAETIFTIRKTLIEQRKMIEEGVDVTKSDLIAPPYVSDRRWKKIMWMMKTSAYLNGREEVDYSDCLLMQHMLWDNDEQVYSVAKLVAEAIASNIRHTGMPGIIDKVQTKRYTKPVGELVSPDGIHYIFTVGEEELLISRYDYEKLDARQKWYGQVTDDNKLVVTDRPTSLSVHKTDTGVAVNSYSYPLKRTSSLRSATVDAMIKDVSSDVDAMEEGLKRIVDANIFVPSYNNSLTLRSAFKDIRIQIIRSGR